MIQRCSSVEQPGWLALREALWPDGSTAEHRSEMAELLRSPERFANFVAYAQDGRAVGLAEASLRTDYVNGTHSSPVGFLEGLYVVPDARRQGIARELVEQVVAWARSAGCKELASDTHWDNVASQRAHEALGFAETERVVCYSRSLRAR